MERRLSKEAHNALLAVIVDVHGQHGDDVCQFDIDRIFIAAGLSVPDRRVGDKFAMAKNCIRFIDTMCQSGDWKSYVELEAEIAELKKERDELRDRLLAVDAKIG